MISPRLALAATFLTVAIAVPSVVAAAEASSASTTTTSTASTSTASTSTVAASTVSTSTVAESSVSASSAASHLKKPSAKTFKNCTAIKKAYSGGIAKKGVKYNVVKHKDGTKTNKALKGKVKFDTA